MKDNYFFLFQVIHHFINNAEGEWVPQRLVCAQCDQIGRHCESSKYFDPLDFEIEMSLKSIFWTN